MLRDDVLDSIFEVWEGSVEHANGLQISRAIEGVVRVEAVHKAGSKQLRRCPLDVRAPAGKDIKEPADEDLVLFQRSLCFVSFSHPGLPYHVRANFPRAADNRSTSTNVRSSVIRAIIGAE